jgi:hypothetical protein
MLPSAELIVGIPNLLNALCLAREGQQAVLEALPLSRLLCFFHDPRFIPPNTACLDPRRETHDGESPPSWGCETAGMTGQGLDELIRHVPGFKGSLVIALDKAFGIVHEQLSALRTDVQQDEIMWPPPALHAFALVAGAGGVEAITLADRWSHESTKLDRLHSYIANLGRVTLPLLTDSHIKTLGDLEPQAWKTLRGWILGLFPLLVPSLEGFLYMAALQLEGQQTVEENEMVRRGSSTEGGAQSRSQLPSSVKKSSTDEWGSSGVWSTCGAAWSCPLVPTQPSHLPAVMSLTDLMSSFVSHKTQMHEMLKLLLECLQRELPKLGRYRQKVLSLRGLKYKAERAADAIACLQKNGNFESKILYKSGCEIESDLHVPTAKTCEAAVGAVDVMTGLMEIQMPLTREGGEKHHSSLLHYISRYIHSLATVEWYTCLLAGAVQAAQHEEKDLQQSQNDPTLQTWAKTLMSPAGLDVLLILGALDRTVQWERARLLVHSRELRLSSEKKLEEDCSSGCSIELSAVIAESTSGLPIAVGQLAMLLTSAMRSNSRHFKNLGQQNGRLHAHVLPLSRVLAVLLHAHVQLPRNLRDGENNLSEASPKDDRHAEMVCLVYNSNLFSNLSKYLF